MKFIAALCFLVVNLAAGAQMIPDLPGMDLGSKPIILLQINEVVNDLKLDKKQKSDLKKVVEAYNGEMKKMSDDAQKNPSLAMSAFGKIGSIADDYGNQAIALFTPDQATRFAQVRWQLLGSMALAEPEVQAPLELSEDQKASIGDYAKAVPGNRMKVYMDNIRDPKGLKKKLDAYRDEVDATLLKMLTVEQTEKYKALLGEPFKDLKKIRG